MKTVQETLREMNKAEVVSTFLRNHPSQLKEFDDQLTIGEAKAKARKLIDFYIDRLLSLKIKPNKDNFVFYMYEYLGSGSLKQQRGLSSIQDLEEKGTDAPNYGIEYTEQAEIMGYFVADTELTQYYLMDLIQDILWDACFFGIEQKHLSKAIAELKQASEEELAKSFTSFEEFEKEVFGDEPLPPKLNKEDAAEKDRIISKTYSLVSDFNKHLQEIEIKKILQN